MEFEKAAACKIQTAASTSCLVFFRNVLYKGYTLEFRSLLLVLLYLIYVNFIVMTKLLHFRYVTFIVSVI